MSLQDVYARLPQMECRGLCQHYCGPVPFHEAERSGLEADWVEIGGGYAVPHPERGLDCVFLKGGRCSVYERRPLICRVWGMTPALPCPHGCEPERWMTQAQVDTALRHVKRAAC